MTVALEMKMYLRLLMRRNNFCVKRDKRTGGMMNGPYLVSYCLNLAAINIQIIILAKFPTLESRRSHKCHTFLENLGLLLLLPWLERRKTGATFLKS